MARPPKKKTPASVAERLHSEAQEAPSPSLQLQPELAREKTFYNVPNSSASDLILKALGSGANLAELPERTKKVNHHTQMEVLGQDNRRRIISNSGKSTVTLELSDIEKLVGSNKAAKKMFVLSLIKLNDQAYSNGVLYKDHIGFPLQELVDIGNYKNLRTARRGFLDAADILTSLKIKGSLHISNQKEATVNALEVLFTGASIEKGYCTIHLNPRVNWAFIASFYTILPRYCFKLPNRSFDLLYYIFYIARQNTREIEQRGFFNISFRAIQQRLNLPSEKGNANPSRTIKDPIEESIAAIEAENNNTDFTMTPFYNESASISDYLDNGFLRIALKGRYAENFIAFSQTTTKKIDAAKKRKMAIEDRAKANQMQKQMEKREE